ncbi:hypothetical protein SALBM311S_13083 [Streptomyces alboniger]
MRLGCCAGGGGVRHRAGLRRGSPLRGDCGRGGCRDSGGHPSRSPPRRAGRPTRPRNDSVVRPRYGSSGTPPDGAGHPAAVLRPGGSERRGGGCRSGNPWSARVPDGHVHIPREIFHAPVRVPRTRCRCPCPTERLGRLWVPPPPPRATAHSGKVREEHGMTARQACGFPASWTSRYASRERPRVSRCPPEHPISGPRTSTAGPCPAQPAEAGAVTPWPFRPQPAGREPGGRRWRWPWRRCPPKRRGRSPRTRVPTASAGPSAAPPRGCSHGPAGL